MRYSSAANEESVGTLFTKDDIIRILTAMGSHNIDTMLGIDLEGNRAAETADMQKKLQNINERLDEVMLENKLLKETLTDIKRALIRP